MSKPTGQTINDIVTIVESHWNIGLQGAAKLPVLAVYAMYQCLISEVVRFSGCSLMDMLSHTTADTKSERVGDVQVQDSDGNAFEAVEIKHKINITSVLLDQIKGKIASSGLKTFYLLSTYERVSMDEMNKITQTLIAIRNQYGCQVIVNGVASTLKYYLRLVKDTDKFVHKYASLVESDSEIPFELKQKWNELIG